MSITERMFHTQEEKTCPVVDVQGDYHLEGRCEDCDVRTLSRLTLGEVEDRHHAGRITQEQYEAYDYVHSLLSGTRYTLAVPAAPAARRIARKLLRAHGDAIPAELNDVHALEHEATEVGRSRGYTHAAYVDAYGGDMNEAPVAPLRFAEVDSFFESGFAEGVENYRHTASDCE